MSAAGCGRAGINREGRFAGRFVREKEVVHGGCGRYGASGVLAVAEEWAERAGGLDEVLWCSWAIWQVERWWSS